MCLLLSGVACWFKFKARWLKASVQTAMAAAGAANVGDIEEDASQLSFPKGGFKERFSF